MTLKVRVEWPHAGTTLLPEDLADIRLNVDGGTAPLRSQSVGAREFEVHDGARVMAIIARFSVKFAPVKIDATTTVPEMTEVVWRASQAYKIVDGTAIEPIDQMEYGKGHPLIETTAASSVHGAVLLRLRTEFVNISKFWTAYAEPAQVAQWITEHNPNVDLFALGYTGGQPLIWFASIPRACLSPPQPAISCLTFFRPGNPEGYTRVDQPQHMWRLNRFLLKPDSSAPAAQFWKQDRFTKYDDKGTAKLYVYLRCGFEDALENSGKPVVMLHPWPNKQGFGQAASRDLPRLADRAIKFLWAEQKIGKQQGGIHLGRLGLAGFSAGGLAMWPTLLANEDTVEEVYAFDARGFKPEDVIQWFNRKPTRRLRMTSAYLIAEHEAIRTAIGSNPRVSNFPSSPSAYLTPRTIPAWDHALSGVTAPFDEATERAAKDDWHQFAVFGTSVPHIDSFLELFLNGSGF